MGTKPKVMVLATQGAGSFDEQRIVSLLRGLEPSVAPFDRDRKIRSAIGILRQTIRDRPELTVLEGTGLGGGLAVMIGRLVAGVPYVVSTGDAVAPFFALRNPMLRPFGALYERCLYRLSAGVVGWTPYLVGRAMTLGAPKAMTAENWSSLRTDTEPQADTRSGLGIPEGALVIGLAGSLVWTRHAYCYGMELVKAVRRTSRQDVCVLIVGDGDGRKRLESEAGDDLGRRVFLPGAVPRDELPHLLAVMDAASLPQSGDGVGAFRYTTKLSEYLCAGLPVVTGRLPFSYDLDDGWLWRFPGASPWDERYVAALARWMDRVTPAEITLKAERVPRTLRAFDETRQRASTEAFVRDLIEDRQS